MPLVEARQWERLALDGPGPYQTALLLAQILAVNLAGPKSPPPPLHEICPWIDDLDGEAEEVAESRRAREADDRVSRLAAASKAMWRAQHDGGD